jgi:hypothetical protein
MQKDLYSVAILNPLLLILIVQAFTNTWGHAMAQLVETLHYKLEGRGFDSQWCH